MRRNLSPAWAIGTFVAALAVGGCLAREDHKPLTPPPATDCQEDEACWDCETMGNHICGPTTTVVTITDDGVELIPPITIQQEG